MIHTSILSATKLQTSANCTKAWLWISHKTIYIYGCIAVVTKRASPIAIFIWEMASDHRPMVTRPPPDGRWQSAEEKRKQAVAKRESPMKNRESPMKKCGHCQKIFTKQTLPAFHAYGMLAMYNRETATDRCGRKNGFKFLNSSMCVIRWVSFPCRAVLQ